MLISSYRAIEFAFVAHGNEETTPHPKHGHHSSLHSGHF